MGNVAAMESHLLSLIPPHMTWVGELGNVQLENGVTVLMKATMHPNPRYAVKLINLLLSRNTFLWIRDFRGRNVLMYACENGAHPRVLQCLVKWLRKRSTDSRFPVSWLDQDVDGKDAVGLAIYGGYVDLVEILLTVHEQTDKDSWCAHNPMRVLELAIEARSEHCAVAVLRSKTFAKAVERQPPERFTTWQTKPTRVYNIYTCTISAVCCNMSSVLLFLHKLDPEKTRQAAWYAVYTHQNSAVKLPSDVIRLASTYPIAAVWCQARQLLLFRVWERLERQERELSVLSKLRKRCRYGFRNWDTIASHYFATVPTPAVAVILSYLLPNPSEEVQRIQQKLEEERTAPRQKLPTAISTCSHTRSPRR